MTISWRLGTAEPIQSSGGDVTVFWRLGAAFVSHEYEESGTPEYRGSGSVEINFGASATGGYFVVGEGNVEVDFGITSTGTYACIGSASVEVDISCSGSGEYEGLLSEIIISPAIANVRPGGTRLFTAIGYDAVGNIVEIESELWEVDAGGTIDPDTGLFTAGDDLVSGTVTCTSGEIVGEATVNIVEQKNGVQHGFSLSIGIGF